MKPYGMPRLKERTHPDAADIKEPAMPSRYGKQHGRRERRRLWHKSERARVRESLRDI